MKEKFRYYIQLEDGWYIQGQEDESYDGKYKNLSYEDLEYF